MTCPSSHRESVAELGIEPEFPRYQANAIYKAILPPADRRAPFLQLVTLNWARTDGNGTLAMFHFLER